MKNFNFFTFAALLALFLTAAPVFSQTAVEKCASTASKTAAQLALEDELKSVHFLAGTWKVENRETYEFWAINDDCSLEGKSYRKQADKEMVTEFLSLRMVDKKITYAARVINQNEGRAIEFVLNGMLTDKFSFENLNHDFPKKIQYKKIDDSTLMVQVLGENDRGFGYKMMRQK
jgi:hypothetical protein